MVGKRCQQNEETGLVGERQRDNERPHSFSVFVFLRGKLEDSERAAEAAAAAAGAAKPAPFSPAGTLLLLICLLLAAPSEGDAATARSPVYYAQTHTHTHSHTHPHTPGRDGRRPLVSESAALGSTQPLPRSLKGDRRRCGGWAGRTRRPRQTC